MAELTKNTGIISYSIEFTPEELDVLRDIIWMDAAVPDADACGLRRLFRHTFGPEYGTNGKSRYKGRL